MSRSVWKGNFVDPLVLKEMYLLGNQEMQINNLIWSRRCTIIPAMVGKSFDIYNGKRFITIKVVENMVFHKFGEFVYPKKLGHKIHASNSTKKGQTFLLKKKK